MSARAWRSTTRCSSSSPTCRTLCIGHGGQHGRVPAGGGRQGQALRAAELARHDPPAARAASRARRPTSRSTPGDPQDLRERLNEILAEHTGQPIETDRARHRARQLHVGRRGARTTAWSTRCLQKRPRPRWPALAVRRTRRAFDARRRYSDGITRHSRKHASWPTKRLLRRKASVLLVLRQEPARGAEADRRPVGLHLRRVHRALQRHHPRGGRRRRGGARGPQSTCRRRTRSARSSTST